MKLLQRYILIELLKVFTFALSVLTVLLVFVGIFQEATQAGLGPLQILKILPYVVPSLLPFTIPATLLLTVCVVYGRIAGDKETVAAKAAGISALSLLWPAFFLGTVLSVCSLILTDQVIPWAVANIERKVTLAMEDIFLDKLRTQRYVNHRAKGIAISVIDVQGKKLIMPTFRYTPPGKSPITIQAQEATLEFDLDAQQVLLHLVRGHVDMPGRRGAWFVREDRPFPLPFETDRPKPRHLSMRAIQKEKKRVQQDHQSLVHRRDAETALVLALGDFERFVHSDFDDLNNEIEDESERLYRLNTALHSRFSLACSCFFFVLLGAPFSIIQARRQFLTSFFLCFMPILLVYYPLVLLMLNLSKEGNVNPAWAMWVGNATLLLASAATLRRVLKH